MPVVCNCHSIIGNLIPPGYIGIFSIANLMLPVYNGFFFIIGNLMHPVYHGLYSTGNLMSLVHDDEIGIGNITPVVY